MDSSCPGARTHMVVSAVMIITSVAVVVSSMAMIITSVSMVVAAMMIISAMVVVTAVPVVLLEQEISFIGAKEEAGINVRRDGRRRRVHDHRVRGRRGHDRRGPLSMNVRRDTLKIGEELTWSP